MKILQCPVCGKKPYYNALPINVTCCDVAIYGVDKWNDYAALRAHHTALKEAVKRLRKIEGNKSLHPVVDGLLISARAEVDRLLGKNER